MTGTAGVTVPACAIPGGIVCVTFDPPRPVSSAIPQIRVGDVPARVVGASSRHLRFRVPSGTDGGVLPVHVEPDGLDVGTVIVARLHVDGLHQVDSPAFDGLGRLYVTNSGSRGVKTPVPLHRVWPDGRREPLAVEIPNPTSLALGPDGAMYVSSRFEGQVYRLADDDTVDVYASDLGVPTGLAFAGDGTLFVGDRSGTIFRVSRDRQVDTFASLPPSVAAFHLAFGPDDHLYVSAPTLSAHDVVYRISPDRLVDSCGRGFGRPQGLAFDHDGTLYVVDALAGASGVDRLAPLPEPLAPARVVAAPAIVGLAFDPRGGVVVASSDAIWRFDGPLGEVRGVTR